GQTRAYGASHRCNVFIKAPFKTLVRPAQGNREGPGERLPRQQHGNHADAFAVQIARKEKALFANLVDRSHHVLQRDSAAAHGFSVIVAIDQRVDVGIGLVAEQCQADSAAGERSQRSGFGRVADRLVGTQHMHILRANVALRADDDSLAGTVAQILHQRQHSDFAEQLLGYPASQHGDAHGRQIGLRLAVVFEITKRHQALQHRRAARYRVLERVTDRLQSQRAALAIEEFHNFEHASRRLDRSIGHRSLPEGALHIWKYIPQLYLRVQSGFIAPSLDRWKEHDERADGIPSGRRCRREPAATYWGRRDPSATRQLFRRG